jgi:enamine deaminase RidA (YjgF/YER057c/UK114 family)
MEAVMTTGSAVPTVTRSAASPARINPTTWNEPFGFDQAQLRRAPEWVLTVAGQGPVDGDGQLVHEGDVAAQVAQAMANVEIVLAAAGMDLGDVFGMTVYAVDVDAVLASYGAIGRRLAAYGATPPSTLVGVDRLSIPGMAVEITVTAGR